MSNIYKHWNWVTHIFIAFMRMFEHFILSSLQSSHSMSINEFNLFIYVWKCVASVLFLYLTRINIYILMEEKRCTTEKCASNCRTVWICLNDSQWSMGLTPTIRTVHISTSFYTIFMTKASTKLLPQMSDTYEYG